MPMPVGPISVPTFSGEDRLSGAGAAGAGDVQPARTDSTNTALSRSATHFLVLTFFILDLFLLRVLIGDSQIIPQQSPVHNGIFAEFIADGV